MRTPFGGPALIILQQRRRTEHRAWRPLPCIEDMANAAQGRCASPRLPCYSDRGARNRKTCVIRQAMLIPAMRHRSHCRAAVLRGVRGGSVSKLRNVLKHGDAALAEAARAFDRIGRMPPPGHPTAYRRLNLSGRKLLHHGSRASHIRYLEAFGELPVYGSENVVCVGGTALTDP